MTWEIPISFYCEIKVIMIIIIIIMLDAGITRHCPAVSSIKWNQYNSSPSVAPAPIFQITRARDVVSGFI